MRGILAFSSVLALSARAERSLDAGACAGARSVRFRFVHVPKSGGMTLTCSFDLGYRAGLPPCRALERTRVPTELEGRHRTAGEFALAGDDAATPPLTVAGACLPMITMLAHPVKRFLSAFRHRPAETKAARYRTCYFLVCRANSELARRNMAGDVSADEFALWPHAEDVEAGHNMATKYLGGDKLFYGANGWSRIWVEGLVPGADETWTPVHAVALRNDTEGRLALARAKARLEAMAVVGLVERFAETLALLEAVVGVKAPGLCVCNVNPFKPSPSASVNAGDSGLSAAARARLERDNALDVELYEFARALFARRLREHAIVAPGFSRATTKTFTCDTNRTHCEMSGELVNDGSGELVPAERYRASHVGAGRIARGGHHACVYPCPRADQAARLRGAKRKAQENARATCEHEIGPLARTRANPSAMARFRACFEREVTARVAAYHADGVS